MKKVFVLIVMILTGMLPVYSAQIGFGGGFGAPAPQRMSGYMGSRPTQYRNHYQPRRDVPRDYVTRTGTIAPVKSINCLGTSSRYIYIGSVPMACNSASTRHVSSSKVKYKTGNKISDNKVRKVSL